MIEPSEITSPSCLKLTGDHKAGDTLNTIDIFSDWLINQHIVASAEQWLHLNTVKRQNF